MNLAQALRIVSSTAWLPGESDAHLAMVVNGRIGSQVMREAPVLHGGAFVRPIDVLLRLALATRPRYQADVHDLHAHWALLRYLGIFDHSSGQGAPNLLLSGAGHRVLGNQRRVMSEELGIGFAVLLAEEWTRNRLRTSGAPQTVDIDVALAAGTVAVGPWMKSVTPVSSRRPDYLLISPDAAALGRFRVALLETKGTKSSAHGLTQLVSAADQLRGVEVDGRQPAGLAVSAVVGAAGVSFRALELDNQSTLPGDHRVAVGDAEVAAEPAVDIDDADLLSAPELDLSTDEHVARPRLVAAGLAAAWAELADFGGNETAFERWSSSLLKMKVGRSQLERRDRVERSTRSGGPFRGVRNVIALPGGDLEVFMGIDAALDDALSEGRPASIFEEQARVARSGRESSAQEEAVASVTDSGAALLLTPL